MSNKYLIVVDMQNDFIDGALGTPEAQAIVENVVRKVQEFPGHVIFTLDTHQPDYLQTQEGKNLPVEHCIEGAHGWQLADALETIRAERDLPLPKYCNTSASRAESLNSLAISSIAS